MAQRADTLLPSDPTALEAEHEDATDEDIPAVVWVTPEDGRRMLDEAAREMAGMSGEEFIRRYDAGEFADMNETEANRYVIELALMIPLARQTTA